MFKIRLNKTNGGSVIINSNGFSLYGTLSCGEVYNDTRGELVLNSGYTAKFIDSALIDKVRLEANSTLKIAKDKHVKVKQSIRSLTSAVIKE